jgi:hypothetical protein
MGRSRSGVAEERTAAARSRNGKRVERLIEIGYRPLPSQKRFHEAEARFKGFSGPIGSGKSQALCHEALRLALCNPKRTGLLGAPTYPMLRDATQAAFLEILDGARIQYEHNKAENWLRLTETHSKILFRSLDEYERLRGTNLAWFGVDELTYTSEEAWLRLEGRLRDPKAAELCGFGVWTPKGYDWVYRRFIQETDRGYAVVQAAPFENRHVLAKVPDFYERLRSSYDEAFFEQEVLGRYLSPRKGLVYRAFDRAENIRELKRDESLPLYWALDFNVDPMASVIVQIRGDVVEVLDEIVLRRASTEDACEEFWKRYPRWPRGLTIYADAAGRHMQTAGASDEELIRSFFARREEGSVEVRIPSCNPSVRERVNLVNSRLRAANGDIRLLVDTQCTELIKDFEEVAWVEGSHEIDKGADKRRTHLSDALGYLVWMKYHRESRIGPRRNFSLFGELSKR